MAFSTGRDCRWDLYLNEGTPVGAGTVWLEMSVLVLDILSGCIIDFRPRLGLES